MNDDSNNDLARYHGFPPLSPPHKPTELDDLLEKARYDPPMTKAERAEQMQSWMRGEMAIGSDADEAACCTPTPTITQMADKHEQETFADDVMQYLHWATCVVGGVVITTFIVALLFRLVVGVY